MATLTLSVSEEFRNKLRGISWVNWSGVAREELQKRLIFENYLKKKKLSKEDWEFCERIDWHPVDELPLKKGFIEKMRHWGGEKPIKVSIKELFDGLRH